MSLFQLLGEQKHSKKSTPAEKKVFYMILDKKVKEIFTPDFFQEASKKRKHSAFYTISCEKIPRCTNYTKHVTKLLNEIYPNNPFGVKCVLIDTCKINKLAITISW